MHSTTLTSSAPANLSSREARFLQRVGPSACPSAALVLAQHFACDATEVWEPLVEPIACGRRFFRLYSDHLYEVWLIGWSPGVRLPLHDHGGVSGAIYVVRGALDERFGSLPFNGQALRHRVLTRGQGHALGTQHVHEVTNAGTVTAYSIHAYTPRLRLMNGYVVDEAQGTLARNGLVEHTEWL